MQSSLSTSAPAPAFAADLLRGAEQIAEFLFGDPCERRKVYHLAETSRLPVFRLGAVLCARRSVLLEWVAHQEQRSWNRARSLEGHPGIGLPTTASSPLPENLRSRCCGAREPAGYSLGDRKLR